MKYTAIYHKKENGGFRVFFRKLPFNFSVWAKTIDEAILVANK